MNTKQNRHLRRYVLWIADTIVTVFSYLFGVYMRNGGVLHLTSQVKFVIAAIVAICTAVSLAYDFNYNFMNRRIAREIRAVLSFNFFVIITLIILFYMVKVSTYLSRGALLIFAIANVVAMTLERLVIKYTVSSFYGREGRKRKVLIITDKDNASSVRESFDAGLTYISAGFVVVDSGKATGEVSGRKVEVNQESLAETLATCQFDEAFICFSDFDQDILRTIVEKITLMGVAVHLSILTPTIASHASRIIRFGNYICLDYYVRHVNYAALLIKRLIDIVGAIVGLFLTGLIAIFLIPAIRLDSPGPALFSQIRVGLNGKRFKLYKFRSMYVGAEDMKAGLMKRNEMSGPMFKIKDDPRITPVGRFIRKMSLDEFPQFFNVLKGDMSLVGTRPPTEDEFMQYDEIYRKRLSMKPGITGLWQISGRSKITDFNDVVKMDLQYIDNWSLGRDFVILAKTVVVVIRRSGSE